MRRTCCGWCSCNCTKKLITCSVINIYIIFICTCNCIPWNGKSAVCIYDRFCRWGLQSGYGNGFGFSCSANSTGIGFDSVWWNSRLFRNCSVVPRMRMDGCICGVNFHLSRRIACVNLNGMCFIFPFLCWKLICCKIVNDVLIAGRHIGSNGDIKRFCSCLKVCLYRVFQCVRPVMNQPAFNKIVAGKWIWYISIIRSVIGMYHIHNCVIQTEIQIVFICMIGVAVVVPCDINLIPVSVNIYSCPDMTVSFDSSAGNSNTSEKHCICTVICLAGTGSSYKRTLGIAVKVRVIVFTVIY